MRATKRTGAWWYMQEISKIIDKKPWGSDGEYFFTPGGLIKQVETLPLLRNWYAYILLLERFINKRNKQRRIRNWLFKDSRPGQRLGVWKEINSIYPQLAAIKRRLDKLPNPYGIEFKLEY